MFTHDLQPIIDYIHGQFFNKLGLRTSVNVKFLQNVNGIISETSINRDDLINSVELAREITMNKENKLHIRVVNLRKYIEMIRVDYVLEPIYQVLSNIIHGRETALDKDKNELLREIFYDGCTEIKKYIDGYDYNDFIVELPTTNLLSEINTADMYKKIIAIRLLLERTEEDNDNKLLLLRRTYPAACKFLNETNHIENDYMFQLNSLKFFDIPAYYLKEIEKFLVDNENLIN